MVKVSKRLILVMRITSSTGFLYLKLFDPLSTSCIQLSDRASEIEQEIEKHSLLSQLDPPVATDKILHSSPLLTVVVTHRLANLCSVVRSDENHQHSRYLA